MSASTRSVFDVVGMCCQSEAQLIEDKLAGLEGVYDISINIPTGTVAAFHRPEQVTSASIVEAISSVGLKARLRTSTSRGQPQEGVFANRRFWTMSLGAVCIGLAALARYALNLETASIVLFSAAIVVAGAYVFKNAVIAVRHGQLDISVLMTIAVIGAVVIGEWFEASTVVVLFAFAEWLETMSMSRARGAITELMELAPPVASVRRGELEVEVSVDEVQVGDVVVVRPGAKIPIDGSVLVGKSDVNEAPITGESVPVLKMPGADVFAGTLNGRGSLDIRAREPAANSTLAHIIDAIEQARRNQSSTERFVDRFARVYTPAVVVLAALVAIIPPLAFAGLWEEWFYRALVLLVIACPCALVISTPVATVAGLARAARRGILIKGGLFLERLGLLRAVAFDKTGTLTMGKPAVSEVVAAQGVEEDDVVLAAAIAEVRSEHHIAHAILHEAGHRNLHPRAGQVAHFEAEIGAGVQATLVAEGSQPPRILRVGTARMLQGAGVDTAALDTRWAALEEQGRTVVGVSRDTTLLGLLSISDTPRPEGQRALADLRELGITEIHVLTGDNAASARAMATEIGIPYSTDTIHARLLPQDKVDLVTRMSEKNHHVAMVGDGVNDAPALARASVGIAMGAAGTDVALESADVALMSDDLRKLPEAIRVGRQTLRIIKQNIFIAIALKVIFLGLAAVGLATLWMAIIADLGASLIVIFNALRLLSREPALDETPAPGGRHARAQASSKRS